MKRSRCIAWLSLPFGLFLLTNAHAVLKVGVTLHPYYSWVKNIGGDYVEVVPLLPENFDPHVYQPRQQDMQVLESLDAMVINGHGHDDFIAPMLQALGSGKVALIEPAAGVPHVHSQGVPNSHAFLSITSAVQQSYAVARALTGLDAQNARHYQQAAQDYAKRLRKNLAAVQARLSGIDTGKITIAITHDAYRYMIEELGIKVDVVIQPHHHGAELSLRELIDSIEKVLANGDSVIFGEPYSPALSAQLHEQGATIVALNHGTHGAYSGDKFERDMAENHEAIVRALHKQWLSMQ